MKPTREKSTKTASCNTSPKMKTGTTSMPSWKPYTYKTKQNTKRRYPYQILPEMRAETGKKHLGETKQMRMQKNTGRYVYIVRTDRESENESENISAITIYGTYKRANKALHERMIELLEKGKYTDQEIAQAKKRFILYDRYFLRDENGVMEDRYISIHKVF